MWRGSVGAQSAGHDPNMKCLAKLHRLSHVEYDGTSHLIGNIVGEYLERYPACPKLMPHAHVCLTKFCFCQSILIPGGVGRRLGINPQRSRVFVSTSFLSIRFRTKQKSLYHAACPFVSCCLPKGAFASRTIFVVASLAAITPYTVSGPSNPAMMFRHYGLRICIQRC